MSAEPLAGGAAPPAQGRPAAGPAGAYFVSTDRALLDLDFVCAALGGSYWAKGRPRGVIERSIAASLCFGVYEAASRRQVAFARVVTDGATFSWLCDVVVDGAHRGRGLGKLLVSSAVAHPDARDTMWLLGTRDAHGLYQRFGFARAEMMRRPSPGWAPPPGP